MFILFISSSDKRKDESVIAIRSCRVGTLYHMTSRGNGRNFIYFQTYVFEFFCKIQNLTPFPGGINHEGQWLGAIRLSQLSAK
jgi:hypothetical protein